MTTRFRIPSCFGIDNMLLSRFSRVRLWATPCDPIDGSPSGSPVPGILQARTLEWVAISFSSAWKWKVKMKSLSRVRPSATPWTAAHQAPPSMGFSRQEYWSGVPLPSPWEVTRKMQIKTAMRCHFTSSRMAIVKKTENSKCWKGCGETGALILLVRM